MTEHRTKILSALLPIALATGYAEVEPSFEPLKVLLLSYLNHRVADLFTSRTLILVS
jgi:predicted branched-subunit amino acid permease